MITTTDAPDCIDVEPPDARLSDDALDALARLLVTYTALLRALGLNIHRVAAYRAAIG